MIARHLAERRRADARRYRKAYRATLRPMWWPVLCLAAGFAFLALLEFIAALEATP